MKYPIQVIIFFSLFVLASLVQLFLAFTENQRLRRKEKFACMLFLGIAAIFAFPNEPLIYVGAFLGMLGDILVLRKNTFISGVVAFFLGHLCYIFEAIWRIVGFENISPVNYVVFGLTYIVIGFVVFAICRKNKNHSLVDVLGQALYFAILVTYIPVFTFATFAGYPLMGISLAGACVFICSDSILVITHFGKKFKRYDFYIMLTYLVAELMIILGFVLTLAK